MARTNERIRSMKLLEWRLRADKRNVERLPTAWTDDMKQITTNWIRIAQNRKK